MNNRPLPLCPWCGKVMHKYITPFSDGKFGGHYGCGSISCGTSAPFVEAESWDECAELAYKAAMKRPPQKPMQPSEIFQQSYQMPCWLERLGDIRISPEVLDKDSAGYFGKIESTFGLITRR